jgi:type II secretory pathway pseudopilin PulG
MFSMDCLTNMAVGRASNLRGRSAHAFTLLEVVLAVVIAIGILLVALAFYQQSANLRGALLLETERLSTIRLLMDRITTELRATPPLTSFQKPLTGGSNFIQFVKTDLTSQSAWTGGALGRAVSAETDLKLISYRLESSDGTNIIGLRRTEEPFVQLPKLSDPEDFFDLEDYIAPSPFSLSEGIHFIRFRYWNGSVWQASWTLTNVPAGIEVSLGVEPPLAGAEPEEETSEVFRRVVYLPSSGAAVQDSISSSNLQASASTVGVQQ